MTEFSEDRLRPAVVTIEPTDGKVTSTLIGRDLLGQYYVLWSVETSEGQLRLAGKVYREGGLYKLHGLEDPEP